MYLPSLWFHGPQSLRFALADDMLAACPAPGPHRCATQEDDVLSHAELGAGGAARPGAALMATLPTPAGDAAALADDASSRDLLARILASLDDDKAEEVVTIDLRGRSDMADYMVVCSGRSSRQVAAISEKLVDRLKHETRRTAKIEGKETGDWVLIDTGDVIVHVFRPEVRDFYQLEKMWMPTGARVPQGA